MDFYFKSFAFAHLEKKTKKAMINRQIAYTSNFVFVRLGSVFVTAGEK